MTTSLPRYFTALHSARITYSLGAFFALIVLAAPHNAAAQFENAKTPTAQQWAADPTASYVQNNPSDQRIARVPMQSGGSAIYFDPTKLDESSMQIGMALRSPNEKAKEPVVAEGIFVSRKIRKTGQNSFEAEGDMYTNNRHTAMKVPFVATFDKTAAKPTLIFDGNFNINSAQQGLPGDSKDFPTEIPVTFHLVTTPQKQAPTSMPPPPVVQ